MCAMQCGSIEAKVYQVLFCIRLVVNISKNQLGASSRMYWEGRNCTAPNQKRLYYHVSPTAMLA